LLREGLELDGADGRLPGVLGYTPGALERHEEARRVLSEWAPLRTAARTYSLPEALIQLGLGDYDGMFSRLNAAAREKSAQLYFCRWILCSTRSATIRDIRRLHNNCGFSRYRQLRPLLP
jgi:hypothetical protein